MAQPPTTCNGPGGSRPRRAPGLRFSADRAPAPRMGPPPPMISVPSRRPTWEARREPETKEEQANGYEADRSVHLDG